MGHDDGEAGLGHVLIVWRNDRKNDVWVKCFDTVPQLRQYRAQLRKLHTQADSLRFKTFKMGELVPDDLDGFK